MRLRSRRHIDVEVLGRERLAELEHALTLPSHTANGRMLFEFDAADAHSREALGAAFARHVLGERVSERDQHRDTRAPRTASALDEI